MATTDADRRPIDPDSPQLPRDCPEGMSGQPPWCYYPTARDFLRLAHSDRQGKPSSARLISSWCMALASLVLASAVGATLYGLPAPGYLEGWFYALVTAATGVNGLGRLGGGKG